jgi:hypothetical protein
VEVNIGDINMRVPIFIIENMTIDLILGRIWTRYIRVYFINEDDGIYIYIIKSPDGYHITHFTASPAQYERNRTFTRHPEEDSIGMEWGKV